jgi:hypothetical protein
MSNTNQTCLIGTISCVQEFLPLKTSAQGNVVAFNKIACNEQEKLPRVLRAYILARMRTDACDVTTVGR